MRFLHLAVALALLGAAVADDKSDTHAGVVEANPSGKVLLFEPFRSGYKEKWVSSKESKYDGEWEWAADYSEVKGDYGAKMASAGKLHAMARKIKGGASFGKDPLVVQFEMKASNGLSCDGGYVKLLQEVQGGLEKFNSDSRYTIMFGPDKCGATDKVHFIVQYQNPVSKQWEEKHAQDVPSVPNDKISHAYTLIVRPDDSFEILIDGESKKKGNLLSDLTPPINPSKEVDDPTDSKPSDWVDEEMMTDPDAKKPADWDENAPEMIEDAKAVKPSDWHDDEKDMIPDPKAEKPADWDDDEDGDWEAPLVPNPKCKASGCGEWKRPKIRNPDYKGKWYAPRIKNPKYIGEWKPRQIPNKDFFEDSNPFKSLATIDSLAIELLTISGGIVFDNILVSNSEAEAKDFLKKTWAVRSKGEKAAATKDIGIMKQIEIFGTKSAAAIIALYKDQPIPFMVGVGVAVLAFMGLVIMCCRPSSSPAPPSAWPPASRAKKTDEVVPDDEDEDEDITSEDEDAPAARTTRGSSAKKEAEEDESPAKKASPKKKTSRKD